MFSILFLTAKAQADIARNEFPEYPSIRNNVEFWEKIYSVYSVDNAVIHDVNDLSKVYEIVKLVDGDTPGSREINEERVDAAKDKYERILLRLAAGHPPETRDEWRVASMFHGPSARRAMQIASENIRSQRGLKERFVEGVERSKKYISRIKQILHEHGLPADLAYLPHVESSFNIQAYSKCGAAGIWQFTRSTGKQFMRIDHRVDERRDPLISTRAAAKLLRQNYDALGSWPLAITAYNYGTAGMVRAVQSHGSYENIFRSYDEGYFKFASRNFYSEFLAARKVAKRLTGYHALYPIHNRSNDAAVSPHSQKGNRKNPIAARHHRIRTYTVKSGDTATSIAEANDISVAQLYKENNLHRRSVLKTGQTLRIPYQDSHFETRESFHSSPLKNKRSAALFRQQRTQDIGTVSSASQPC